jgi:hypothetical protein
MGRINIEIDSNTHKTAKLNALILNITLQEYIIKAVSNKNIQQSVQPKKEQKKKTEKKR